MNRVVCWLTGISRIGRESAICSRDSPTLDFVIDATEVLTSAGGGALLPVWTGTGFADDVVGDRRHRRVDLFAGEVPARRRTITPVAETCLLRVEKFRRSRYHCSINRW